MPPGMTDVAYVYKAQNFQIRIYRGEPMMVVKDGFPVLMISRGTIHPLSQDPNTVSAAEEALKLTRRELHPVHLAALELPLRPQQA
jgi:hypothetical protein